MDAALSEIHRVQRSFRAVMDAMARPGRPEAMPLATGSQTRYPGIGKPLATLIDMLVDQATTFSLAQGCDDALARAIASETHAKSVMPDAASFVIVPERADAPCIEMAIAHATAGSLEDEFPCGIDIVLVDGRGVVVAIPRTSFVSLLAVGKGVK